MDRKFPYHPFLFTLYPILSYWVSNKHFVFPRETWRTIAVCLAGTSLLYLFFWLLSRNKGRSALLASLLAVIFLYYGHVYYSIQGVFPSFGAPLAYTLVWLVLLLLGLYFSLRVFKGNETVNSYLNWVALILVIVPLAQVIQLTVSHSAAESSPPAVSSTVDTAATRAAPATELPDVYYFILDAYGRQDVLADMFAFDNSGFVDALEQRGFYVADQSYTNYMQTYISLSSSLSGDYLDPGQFDPESADRVFVHEYLNTGAHVLRLRDLGYEIVALKDADGLLQLDTADRIVVFKNTLNNFELGFHALTLGKFWSPVLYEYTQWQIVGSQLDALETFPTAAARPRFVFAHLLIPHPPFVFDPEGNFVATNLYMAGDGSHYGGSKQDYASGYGGQVQYLNARLVRIVDHILSDPDRPAVIILQGDHGPGSYLNWDSLEQTCLRERMAIFNAYYFPSETARAVLYPSISPVNSFRVVFDQMLGQPMSLLQDRSYYSTWDRPYDVVDVTDTRASCSPLEVSK